MPDPERKIQRLMEIIQADENKSKVLETLTIGGLVTLDQVMALTGLSEKIVRTCLESLSKASRHIPSSLRVTPVKLAGKTGRPQNAYLPTPEGAQVIRWLYSEAPDHSYLVHDPIDVTALYCMMEIYIAAKRNNLQAYVEKVLPYGERNAHIRADVLVQPASGPGLIFEIEQQLSRNNLPRVVEKLLHLRSLFTSAQSAAFSPEVRILFNVSPDEEDATIQAWQDALNNVSRQFGVLPFELNWMPILDFLAAPDWRTTDSFYVLEPECKQDPTPTAIHPPTEESREEDGSGFQFRLPEVLKRPELDIRELHAVMQAVDMVYQEQVEAMTRAQNQRARCNYFFSLVISIYEASYYPGSDTTEYAGFPQRSLYLLHKYLNAHQNRPLFDQLRAAMPYLQYQASAGIIGFRNALTKIYWDIFLRWHNLARGGPLQVVIQVPDFQDRRSEFYVQIHITNNRMVDPPYQIVEKDRYSMTYRDRRAEEALAWVLEALYLYAYELGLTDKPNLLQYTQRKKNHQNKDVIDDGTHTDA